MVDMLSQHRSSLQLVNIKLGVPSLHNPFLLSLVPIAITSSPEE